MRSTDIIQALHDLPWSEAAASLILFGFGCALCTDQSSLPTEPQAEDARKER